MRDKERYRRFLRIIGEQWWLDISYQVQIKRRIKAQRCVFSSARTSSFREERKMEGWKKCSDPSKTPKFRVELHVHLEGAIRPETLWKLSQRKGHFQHRSLEALRRACITECPSDLPTFLKPIAEYLPLVA
ncbi:hypothetical protein TNCT_285621 [Trichonephila clavata]|uniref:Adenosine deaminase n=1 Tax=Trichonephila clavata TaxID=2740835 RepID=A0A8X6HBZ0_TRICU|nr:hypothetical protein TNCT_285621 [Trichonephila clavata]